MKIKKTSFKDCFLIEKKIFKDQRGFFFEIFKKNEFNEILKKKFNFVQDNLSYSYKGVLRGLHYQKNKPQGKLVRVVCGSIYDVVVDIRKNSPTFGKWEGFNLNSSNNCFNNIYLVSNSFYLVLSYSINTSFVLDSSEFI